MENEKSYIRRRIVVFKTLAISKIVFLSLLSKIPYQVVKDKKYKDLFFGKILLGK